MSLLLLVGCDETKEVVRASPAPSERPAKDPVLPATAKAARLPTPWDSREACLKVLKEAPPKARPGTIRVASWNIRYFPDGVASTKDEPEIDVEWLACGMALINADVFAVQEFKSNDAARRAAQSLTDRLNQHTGGKWQLELDKCGGGDAPHVGMLYDSSKVGFDAVGELQSLRYSQDKECDGDLHPGYAARLTFGEGLSMYLVVLHLQAGEAAGEYDKRKKAWEGMPEALRNLRKHAPEAKIAVTGDFNTDGCKEECEPTVSSSAEVKQLTDRFAELEPSLYVQKPTKQCTEYHGGEPWLFDHFALTKSLQERMAGAVKVAGYCAELECDDDADEFAAAHAHLSDHCPLVLELKR